ncbi:hypothetical protein LG047_15495 [Methylocystis sp. WRRC1]|uniref:helix-turn-helix domain-containing protein n=1 Tax=Methylocystis sp. WRRC1 TaxID=1732014 RepID=UPI001D137552|nr:helix-turn-helix domain-containing protein [Methylocystis sp. WRRC1]MCC3246704.1 hypothetical protein [Methylocystis sp. WRRC1]
MAPKTRFSEAMARYCEEAWARYGVPKGDIFGPSRTSRHYHARRHVWAKMREELGMSYPQIARATGSYDHTTVLHAVRALRGDAAIDRKRERQAASYKRMRVDRISVEQVRISIEG